MGTDRRAVGNELWSKKCRKWFWKKRDDAFAELLKVRQQRLCTQRKERSIYYCGNCKGWHLTHAAQRLTLEDNAPEVRELILAHERKGY